MKNRKWPLGSIMSLSMLVEGRWNDYAAMGLDTCQIILPYDLTGSEAEYHALNEANKSLPMVSMILSWGEPAVWDFIDGPSTLGIVPEAHRARRVAYLKRQLDFVGACGVKLISTHAGFIPESPKDPAYRGVVDTLAELAGHAAQYGISFNLETGQETPVAMKRAILDSGAANLGINLDPANLLMYGKANPVDAVGVFGEYVRSVHIKDGRYPTGDMQSLGNETAVGEGMVDFPALLKALDQAGFAGPLIIEREISGPRQVEDVRRAIAYIDAII